MLEEVCNKSEISLIDPGQYHGEFAASGAQEHGSKNRGDDGAEHPASGVAAHDGVNAATIEDAAASKQRVVAYAVDDEIETTRACGEVFARVIDNVVGAERAEQLDVTCAADCGHLRAKGLGNLDGEGGDSASAAVDEDSLIGLQMTFVAQGYQRSYRSDRNSGGMFERDGSRFVTQSCFGSDGIFGASTASRSEDFIARAEAGDPGADLLDDTGEIEPEERFLRVGQTCSKAQRIW